MVQLYSVNWLVSPASGELIRHLEYDFRPTKVITNVERPGLVNVTGIYCGTPENQLVTPLDGWVWSVVLQSRLMSEFLAEYGLIGKSDEEIDFYCDDHALSMPDVHRIILPSIHAKQPLRLTVECHVPCAIAFLGYGP